LRSPIIFGNSADEAGSSEAPIAPGLRATYLLPLSWRSLLSTHLGEKIRAERKRLKLTLDDLAQRTESSKSYIWELENRPVVRPSADKIRKIADVFGVTVEFLLNDEKQDPSKSDADQAFFRRIGRLDATKRAQLEKFLKAIDDD
jgi:transcriptional regulator with XRE-family HTH domain